MLLMPLPAHAAPALLLTRKMPPGSIRVLPPPRSLPRAVFFAPGALYAIRAVGPTTCLPPLILSLVVLPRRFDIWRRCAANAAICQCAELPRVRGAEEICHSAARLIAAAPFAEHYAISRRLRLPPPRCRRLRFSRRERVSPPERRRSPFIITPISSFTRGRCRAAACSTLPRRDASYYAFLMPRESAARCHKAAAWVCGYAPYDMLPVHAALSCDGGENPRRRATRRCCAPPRSLRARSRRDAACRSPRRSACAKDGAMRHHAHQR